MDGADDAAGLRVELHGRICVADLPQCLANRFLNILQGSDAGVVMDGHLTGHDHETGGAKRLAGAAGDGVDGQQAVDATLAKQYSVVLMDWNMPNMLGIDALKRIRLAGNQVPVIMVTTEAEKGRVIEALKAGANNYVIKPFKPEAIITKIQEVAGAAG